MIAYSNMVINYSCYICHYKCNDISNYNKHLKTKKHVNNSLQYTNKVQEKSGKSRKNQEKSGKIRKIQEKSRK